LDRAAIPDLHVILRRREPPEHARQAQGQAGYTQHGIPELATAFPHHHVSSPPLISTWQATVVLRLAILQDILDELKLSY
jgi:hypothetical protein